MPTRIQKKKSYFMLDEFSTVETLNTIMCRLRGRYTVAALHENELDSPDHGKVKRYFDRAKEISVLMRTIFFTSQEEKEKAIDLFSDELKELLFVSLNYDNDQRSQFPRSQDKGIGQEN